MKILQIRGRNLASLAGEFSLDFEQGPLADAGLFAIAGPTGAGKSTLLDALSLALYDRTPRLESSSGYHIPDGPDESLGVHDPRNLLRRGTAEGLAEVRFIGTDGRRYRASWAVRRARNRVGGKLQPSEMQLFDEGSDQPIGRTKTEVLGATERAVGLTFDQFRRSMLLAQGDFAAFLKARSDERSELLERMTGTALYSAISQRAHARARAIEESLRLQEAAAQALPVLDAEARAACERRVDELTTTVAGIGRQLGVLREHKGWWLQASELASKLAQARERLTIAHQRWTEAATRRQALADIEQVQGLRAIDHDARRTAEEQAAAELRRQAADSAFAQARVADERSAAALAEAAQRLAQCRTEVEAAQPALQQARSLDQAIADKTMAVNALDKKLMAAEDERSALSRQGQALEARQATEAAALAQLARWVADHGERVALASGWEEGVAPQLQAFATAHEQWTTQAAALPAMQQQLDKALAAQQQAQRDLADMQTAVQAALAGVGTAQAAEAAHPVGPLAERRSALEARRTRQTQLQQQHQQAVRAGQECRHHEAEAAKATQDAVQALQQADQAAAARAELALQLAATQRLLLQLGLEAHRAQLVDGEPCPLCGSTHHPGSGPIEATVTVLEAQQHQQAGRHAELQQRETSERTRAEARHARAQELAQAAVRWQAEAQAAAMQWQALGGEGDPAGPAAEAWLNAQGQALAAEAQAIAEQDAAGERLRRAAADARQALDAVAARLEQARTARQAADDTAAVLGTQCRAARADLAARRAVLDATLANLSHAFAQVEGWQQALEADPRAFAADWSARVVEARQQLQAQAQADRQLAEIHTQREVLAVTMKQATLHREALELERWHLAAERDAARAQRQTVLQGRPAAVVEAALQDALSAAELAHAQAAEQARRTGDDVAKKGEAHKIAEQAMAQASQAHARCAQALAEALARVGLDAATLRARLAHEEAWLREEQAALAAIDRLQASEAKAVEERHKDWAAHQAQTAPAQPLAEIEADLAVLEPRHGEQSELLGAARQQLAQDDHHRATGQALARELAQARADAKVWQQLDALIGSADGKKFRKFAQSLTLELLLAHANAELASLAPRYVLQRVKAQDLELQVVDRDMGDEIRSTSSLSGGETFLVSLALALGLSSLASEKVRIESLFIDEGFGSLDPKTLETALSTLDALQSAGRRVGLISHVPGLAERVGVQVLVERQGQGASRVRVVVG